MAGIPTTTPAELKDRIDAGTDVTLVDVRGPADYEEWHIDGETVENVNVPFREFQVGDPLDVLESINTDGEVVAVCATGTTSRQATAWLNQHGVDARNLQHGMNGWAFLYESVELDVPGESTVVQFQRPSSGCLSYLIVSGGEAAVVDPLRAFADTYLDVARDYGADLAYALDTHVHADHVSGARTVGRRASAEVVVPEPAVDRGVQFANEVRTVADGDAVPVGDVDVEVRHTPGHTSGMTAYRVEDVLLTGDGLFVESVARPDLEDADAAREAAGRLYESLQERVLSLPDETVVAPAHFSDSADRAADGSYTARLGDLAEAMDALSMDRSSFVDYILSDMPPRPANYEDIIATNLGQHHPPENVALELELGPNNCAASQDSMAD
ncbi:MAG: MBL fold metallo-hydrolase [Haloarculaceae archaeon]